jgi:hypothetical protein
MTVTPRRVWRVAVICGTFLVLNYVGLHEVHGNIAPWLVLIGTSAVCVGWTKFWPDPMPK